MKSLILPFSKVPLDSSIFGQKGLILSEVFQKGAQIPEGVIISSLFFKRCLSKSGTDIKIKKILNKTASKSFDQHQKQQKEISRLIKQISFSEDINQLLDQTNTHLESETDHVSILFSVPNRHQQTYSWDKHRLVFSLQNKDLETAIKEAWSEAFNQHLQINSKQSSSFPSATHLSLILIPVYQNEISINAFTRNPASGDDSEIWLEAIWGQWRPGDEPSIHPDTYIVDASKRQIKKVDLQKQTLSYKLKAGAYEEVSLSKLVSQTQKLSPQLIEHLTSELVMLKKHYKSDLRVEYSYIRGKLFISNLSQLRKSTAKPKIANSSAATTGSNHSHVARGYCAFPGKVTGRVLFLKSAKDYDLIRSHHIVFFKKPMLALVEKLKKAAGFVSAQHGQASESAVLAREFKIPALIGVSEIFKTASENQVVTLNSIKGSVFHGKVNHHQYSHKYDSLIQNLGVEVGPSQSILPLKNSSISGDVMINSDYFYTQLLPKHPQLVDKKLFVETLLHQLESINHRFYSNRLLYRANRLTQSQFSQLKSGKQGERQLKLDGHVTNGVSRYVKDTRSFEFELEGIAKHMTFNPNTEMVYCLPGITDIDEYQKVVGILSRHLPKVEKYIYLDSVQTLFILEELLDQGISGIVLDLESFWDSFVDNLGDKISINRGCDPQDKNGFLRSVSIATNIAKRNNAQLSLRLGTLNINDQTLKLILETGFAQLIVLPEHHPS